MEVSTYFKSNKLEAFNFIFDDEGNVIAIDCEKGIIFRISILTKQTTIICGSSKEFGLKDGKGNEARFKDLGGLTLDDEGNLFVSDGNYVRKVNLKDNFVSTFVGSGKCQVMILVFVSFL